MSRWQICWDTDGDGVDDVCVPIYVEIRKWPWDEPDPGPWDRFEWIKDVFENPTPIFVTAGDDPHPVPWMQDLIRLSGVAQIAATISDPDVSARLGEDVFSIARGLVEANLPTASLSAMSERQ